MEFDLEKWRDENPMDYLLTMNLINQSSNKNEVFTWGCGLVLRYSRIAAVKGGLHDMLDVLVQR